MGTYLLDGFSPESFEQLIRSLAIAIIGPGVTAFGNGPDGGREATFYGSVPYPFPPNEQWNGYGVVQAKFKENKETTQKDQNWGLAQLKKELDAFVKQKDRTPKPEYYIFATNVVFTSTKTGGKAKFKKMIESYKDKLHLKDYALWDSDQIHAYLPCYESVRKSFAAFLTPGDVLSALSKRLENKDENLVKTLYRNLDQNLQSEAFPRLQQAGSSTEEKLELSQLFLDLQATADSRTQIDDDDDDLLELNNKPGILNELLHASSRKLDPQTVSRKEPSGGNKSEDFYNCFIVLGGPGSGKSTISQFFAQINRAALLERSTTLPLTKSLISNIKDACTAENLPWPATPRYPFRIDLNRLAKYLDTNSVTVENFNIYRYILKMVIYNGEDISSQDFLHWLVNVPLLLIFDGLDEVPTGLKSNILVAINTFLNDLWSEPSSDVFVMATSRLQGYSGEFQEGKVTSRYILPLTPERAILCAQKYATVKFGKTDPFKRDELIETLRRNIKKPYTAQLMETPLQATFMAIITDVKGDPGDNRWQLFNSYYQIIYNREQEKSVSTYNKVLGTYKSIIDRLHQEIGFWLQYQGEISGKDSVAFPILSLIKLVDDYLSEDGIEGDEKTKLRDSIISTAQNRLVFLTSREAGELSFDVRSLQEYMASECILTGGDRDVLIDRISLIARSTYWENVFLFIVNKCFFENALRDLKDTFITLCNDFNQDTDFMFSTILHGSNLALSIIQSGAVIKTPKYSKIFVETALKLIERPYKDSWDKVIVPSTNERLAGVYNPALEKCFEDKLTTQIEQRNFFKSLGAWPLLVNLKEHKWARVLLDNNFPKVLSHISAIIELIQDRNWIFEDDRFLNLVQKSSPEEALKVIDKYNIRRSHKKKRGYNSLYKLNVRQRFNLKARIPLIINGVNFESLALMINTIKNTSQYFYFKDNQLIHDQWFPFVRAKKFYKNPTILTLLEILDDCIKAGWKPEGNEVASRLPWPLHFALSNLNSVEELKTRRDNIEKYYQNKECDFLKIESRWQTKGIEIFTDNCSRDNYSHQDDNFWENFVIQNGVYFIRVGGGVLENDLDCSGLICTNLKSFPVKLINGLLYLMQVNRHLFTDFNPEVFFCEFESEILEGELVIETSFLLLINCSFAFHGLETLIDFIGYKSFERADMDWHYYADEKNAIWDDWLRNLQKAFIQDNSKYGFLCILAYMVIKGRKIEDIPLSILNDLQPENLYFQVALFIVKIGSRGIEKIPCDILANEFLNIIKRDDLSLEHKRLLLLSLDSQLGYSDRYVDFIKNCLKGLDAEYFQETIKLEAMLRKIHSNSTFEINLTKLKLPDFSSY